MLLKLKISREVLKDIFICRILRILRKLNYPKAIIPKLSYVPIINIDSLFTHNKNVYLVRKSSREFDETFNRVGEDFYLREDVINHKEIPPGLSLNLLGGKFKTKHLKFRTLNSANNQWNGEEEIFLSDNIKNYEFSDIYVPIYLHGNEMHRQTIPYNRPKDRNSELELRKFSSSFENIELKGDTYNLKGHSKITHVPTILNYWHVEFILFDYKSDRLEKKSANWIKEFCGQVVQNLIVANAYATEPKADVIVEEAYLKAV